MQNCEFFFQPIFAPVAASKSSTKTEMEKPSKAIVIIFYQDAHCD